MNSNNEEEASFLYDTTSTTTIPNFSNDNANESGGVNHIGNNVKWSGSGSDADTISTATNNSKNGSLMDSANAEGEASDMELVSSPSGLQASSVADAPSLLPEDSRSIPNITDSKDIQSINNTEEDKGKDASISSSNFSSSTASPSSKQENSSSPAEPVTTKAISMTVLQPCPFWSEVLKSPPAGERFLPSKELNKPGSLYGYGLEQAAERSRILSRCGRKYVSMLLDITTLHETLSQSLLKTCSSADFVNAEVCPLESIQSFAQQMKWLAIQIRDHIVVELKDIFLSQSDTVQAMTQKYYAPARQRCFHMHQKTLIARSKYVKAVREAELAWKNYSVENSGNGSSNSGLGEETKEAGVEIDTETEPGNGTGSDTGSEAATPTTQQTSSSQFLEDDSEQEKEKDERVGQKGGRKFGGKLKRLVRGKSTSYKAIAKHVKEVKQLQEQYEEAVKQENRTIQQVQLLETMILEALQKMEEQRTILFVQSLQKVLHVQKSSLDNMFLSVTKKDAESKAQVEKKGTDFFSNLLIKNASTLTSHEHGAGKMEADMLGLPIDVGELRDELKAKLSCRESRIQTARTLSIFLEDISVATAKFSSALKQQVKNDANLNVNNAFPSETLRETLAKLEGARAYQLWTDLMIVLEREGAATAQMARSLKSISSIKLDEFLFNAEQLLKNADDADGAKWRHLCDAQRTESRAQARYKQAAMQTAKARERVKTADDEANAAMAAAATPESPRKGNNVRLNKANERVSHAFGKMFSVLPDGGEHAMQMFRPDARRAVAQRNLKEADVKESKDRQALDSAAVATSRALELYRKGASQIVETYEKEDKAGWDDIKNAIESMVSNVGAFRIALCDSLEKPLSNTGPLNVYLMDQVEWTQRTAKKLEMKATAEEMRASEPAETVSSSSTTISTSTTGGNMENKSTSFMQAAELEESEALSKMMSTMGSSEKEESSAKEQVELAASGITTTEGSTTPKPLITNSVTVDDLIDKELEQTNSSQTRPTPVTAVDTKGSRPNIQIPVVETVGLRSRLNSTNTQESFLNISDNDSVLTTGINAEASVFVSYFMKDSFGGVDSAPDIVESFSCGFLKGERGGKNNLGPVTHGRLFLTPSNAYFVGWMGKKAVLKLTDIRKIEKNGTQYAVATASSVNNDGMGETIHLDYLKGGGKESIPINLGCFLFQDEAFQCTENLLEEAKATAAKALEDAAKAKEESANANNMKNVKAGMGDKSESSELSIKEKQSQENEKEEENITPYTPLPQDTTLKKMEVLLEKSIKNISVQQFYDLVWSESDEKPFYRPWLEYGNCFKIEIGKWEKGEFTGPWDKEAYETKRIVTFHIRRKGLVVGPSVVDCVQEHFCRMEDSNNRCILLMSCKFNKLPYCDCFHVQVRWVISRKGTLHSDGVTVECGVHVDFLKSTFLKSQIRNGTIAETRPTYANLFEWAERYCKDARKKRIEAGEETATEEDDEASKEKDSEIDAEKTDEAEVAEKSIVKPEEKTLQETLLGSTNYVLIIIGVILLVFMYRFIFSGTKVSPPVIDHHHQQYNNNNIITVNDLDIMNKKIDGLQEEMKLMRNSLEEIVTLLRNNDAKIQMSTGQNSDNNIGSTSTR